MVQQIGRMSDKRHIIDSYELRSEPTVDYRYGNSKHLQLADYPFLKGVNNTGTSKGYGSRITGVDLKEFQAAEKEIETITLEISGVQFNAAVDILRKHPHTKLGRLVEYDKSRETENNNGARIYRFYRHPGVFQNILDYYITGELHYPLKVCGVIVQRELEFWEIPSQVVQPCCVTQYCSYIDRQAVLTRFGGSILKKSRPSSLSELSGWEGFRSRVWRFMDDPTSSLFAQAYTGIWFVIVLINIVCFCLETMEVGEVRRNITIDCGDAAPDHRLINKARHELRIIDFISAVLFTCELFLRFVFCPRKRRFFRDPMTYVDALALVPSYVYFALTQVEGYCYYRYINEIELVMVLRVLRVFRITHVLRFYGPFQILVHALRVSGQELLMLATFLTISILIYGTLIFYIERDNIYLNESKTFPDIPSGLWWAIVTMTTLGYGDKFPITPLGYCIGTIVAVTGILIVALAVPIVSSNFCKLYDFYNSKRRLKNAAGSGSDGIFASLRNRTPKVAALENASNHHHADYANHAFANHVDTEHAANHTQDVVVSQL